MKWIKASVEYMKSPLTKETVWSSVVIMVIVVMAIMIIAEGWV